MKINFSRPYRRKDKRLGARARVTATHKGFDAPYAFDTHGMTAEEVAARISAVQRHHERRADRLTGFIAVRGREYVRNGDVYRIVDCTILDNGRPDGPVQLYVDVRRIVGSQMLAVDGFPLKQRYTDVQEVPPDGAIVQMVENELPVPEDIGAKHEAFTRRVDALLKGR